MSPQPKKYVFDMPTPPGRSRESTLRLCADGHFEHADERVTHAGMSRAFAKWVQVHPRDGRFVLANDEDWSYLQVDDTPLLVTHLTCDGADLVANLSNDTAQEVNAVYTRIDGALLIGAALSGVHVWAKFTRHAMFDLGELAELRENTLQFSGFSLPLMPAPEPHATSDEISRRVHGLS